MREIVAASPSGKQAVTNWPGIFPMSPFSPVYLQPPVHRMQGGGLQGVDQRTEIPVLLYKGCGKRENQGTATDFAISEKSETRGEIFVY